MATETRAAGEPRTMIIGGEHRPARSGKTFTTYDPATGKPLAEVAAGTKPDVDDAVGVARELLKSRDWGRVAPAERSQGMWRFAQAIRQHLDELAQLESRDVGKPLREARGDASVCARYFEFYAGVADKIGGHTIPMPDGFTAYTVREPMGVSAHIIPWNYPLQIAGRGVGAALACGNTVVVKPSSEAPLSILRLAEIALEAGLPAGVFNVVTGSAAEVGEPLAGHPGVNQVTFTGSISAGVRVMQLAAENAVPVQLELGGKSPQIVFADADVDEAVAAIGRGIFQNAGQTCSAGSRLLVERGFHGTLVAKLAERARALKLGPGIEDPDMGPLVSRRQLERVVTYVEAGRKDGASLALGGARADDPRLRDGYFFQPTILEGVTNDDVVAREEIFGPVLVAIDFDDLDQVAEMANRSEYGLIAGIWTRDLKKAHYLASRVEAGQIYVNTYGAGGGVELPFGGYRKSGFGREKGLEGLTAYSQVKTVCIKFG